MGIKREIIRRVKAMNNAEAFDLWNKMNEWEAQHDNSAALAKFRSLMDVVADSMPEETLNAFPSDASESIDRILYAQEINKP
jgi:hypothetical protein